MPDFPFLEQTGGIFTPPGAAKFWQQGEMPEGWKVDDVGNVTTPEGWMMLNDGNYISPEGIKYDSAALLRNEYELESLAKIFPVEAMIHQAETDPEAFVRTLQEIGYTPETHVLLHSMGLEEMDINLIFNPPDVTTLAKEQFKATWGTPDSWKGALGIAGAYLEKYVERPWKWIAMKGSYEIAEAIAGFRGERLTTQLAMDFEKITEEYGWGCIFSEETGALWEQYVEKGSAPRGLTTAYEWTNPAWFIPLGGAAGLIAKAMIKIPVIGKVGLAMAKYVQVAERGITYPLAKPLQLVGGAAQRMLKKAPTEHLANWSVGALPNHETYKAALFKKDWFRKAAERIGKHDIWRKLFEPVVGKSLFIQDELGKEIIMRLNYLEMGVVDKQLKMAGVRVYGDSLQLLAANEVGIVSTRLVRPKSPGQSMALRDVVMSPEKYVFTNPKTYDFIKAAQQIIKDAAAMAEKEGIPIHKLPLGDGMEFMGVTCIGKRAPDGSIQFFRQGVGRKVGATTPIEKPRFFEEMIEGLNHGYVYSRRIEDYMQTYIDSVWKKIADKRLADAVEKIVARMDGVLPTKAVERLAILFPREAEAFGRKQVIHIPAVTQATLGAREDVFKMIAAIADKMQIPAIKGFVHYGKVTGLKKLLVRFHGTGVGGTEKRMAMEYPDIYQQRLYGYPARHVKEGKLPDNVYIGGLDPSKVLAGKKLTSLTVQATQLAKTKGFAPLDKKAINEMRIRLAKEAGFEAIKMPEGLVLLTDKKVFQTTKETVEGIVSSHAEYGGATFDLRLGKNAANTKGYALSPFPQRTKIIPRKNITEKEIIEFAAINQDLLAKKGFRMGTWYDKATKKSYLDIAVVTKDRDVALALGHKYKQTAIFDLKRMKDIMVGGQPVTSPGVKLWIMTGIRKEMADLGYALAMTKLAGRGDLHFAQKAALERRCPEFVDRIDDIFTYKVGSPGRKAEGVLVSKYIRAKMNKLRPDWWKARFAREDAMVQAQKLKPTEGKVDHPAFANKIYPKEVADALNNILKEETVRYGLQYPAAVSSILRTFKASVDLSAGRIQGLWTLFRHPLIYVEAEGRSWIAFCKPSTYDKYQVVNKVIMSHARTHGVYYGGFEYFEAARGMIKFFDRWTFTKPVSKLIKHTIGRGEAAFGMWGDVARTEMWRAYGARHVAKGEGFEYARAINRMTGVMSTKAIGMGATQRSLEQAFIFFAPRYKRAGIAFVLDMFRGGVTGAEARKSIGSFLAGGTALYIGACRATGKPAYIFPYFPEGAYDTQWAQQLRDWGLATESAGKKYLSMNINGQWYGVGGIGYGLLRLGAEVVECVASEGDKSPLDLVSLNKWDNPIIRYFYTGGAPLLGITLDVLVPGIEKELGVPTQPHDFLGYPLETPEEYASYAGEAVTPIAFSDMLWGKSGVPPSMLSFLGEWMGMRISPQTRWETFINKVEVILNRDGVGDMTPTQTTAFDKGQLLWEDLDKWQKTSFMEQHTELAPLFEEAAIDSSIRSSGVEKDLERSIGWALDDEQWERAKLIDPDIPQRCGLRGNLRDAQDNIWQMVLDGKIDRYQASDILGDARAAFRGGWEVLENEEKYKETFEVWDKAREDKLPNAELFDICYYDYTMLRMSPPLNEYDEIDWDEFTRLETALFAGYPDDYREKVYFCIEHNKEQEAPWAIMRWLDVKKLGDEGYWDLPRVQIKNMDEDDIAELNPLIYDKQISYWNTYNEAETDAEKARLIELFPDLNRDWRGEFFLTHPEHEAGAVFWGYRNKFSTQEALDIAMKKVEELGLTEDEFMAGLAMPPKRIWPDYFEWMKLGTETGWQSAEVKYFKATHPDFFDFGEKAYGWKADDTPVEVLEISSKWAQQDKEYAAIQPNAKLGIDEITASVRRHAYLGANPEYAKARRIRDAYNKGIADWATRNGFSAESLVEAYAEYYMEGGQRAGWSDERFLLEHMELYNALIDLEIFKVKIDWREVPTASVEALYREYNSLPTGVVRLNFRQKHPDLDDWLVYTKGMKPIGDRALGEVAKPPKDIPFPTPGG